MAGHTGQLPDYSKLGESKEYYRYDLTQNQCNIMGDVVTSFHEVKQLFLIPIPGVLTQNLGNIVGTWSALWSLTVCVLFLRLCYSGITFYQQCENNLGR